METRTYQSIPVQSSGRLEPRTTFAQRLRGYLDVSDEENTEGTRDRTTHERVSFKLTAHL